MSLVFSDYFLDLIWLPEVLLFLPLKVIIEKKNLLKFLTVILFDYELLNLNTIIDLNEVLNLV